MRRSIRLVIVASAALATLAFAGSAWAVYAPSLTVTSSSNSPGKATSILLGHIQTKDDDATAKDTIYAPLGYQTTLGQPIGTKIGDVSARLILRNGGNAEVDVDGTVVADDPALHPSDTCAPGLHGAVWKLNITVAGTPLTVFVYVDVITTGPEATFASAKIQFCLAGPIGTPAGAQLLFAFFDVNKVFTNPSTATDHVWHATFTPYTPNTPNPNPTGTTEGQAVVPGKVAISVKSKSLKHGVVLISGRVLIDGKGYKGALVELYVPGKVDRVGKATTKADGSYTIRQKIKKKTRYIVQVLHLGDLGSCPAPGLPGVPQGCKTATISFFAFNTVTARRKP